MRFVFIYLVLFASFLFSDTDDQLQIRNRNIYKRKNIIVTEPSEIINIMKKRFTSFKTFSAKFKELSSGRLKSGTIIYQKPHSLFVSYLKKNGNSSIEVYANEKKIFVYLKELNIVAEQDLSDKYELTESKRDSPVIGVVNLDRLLENYNFNFLESKNPVGILKPKETKKFLMKFSDKVKAYRFLLTPKDKTRGLNHMELWVSPKGYILRAKCFTIENRLIDFVFYSIVLNEDIPKKTFEFAVPANAQVLKNSFGQPEGLSE